MRRTKGQQSGCKLPVNFSGVVFKYSKVEDQKLYNGPQKSNQTLFSEHVTSCICVIHRLSLREYGNFLRCTACYVSCCRTRATSYVFQWILNSSLSFKQV